MTPHELRSAVTEVWTRLQNSPAGRTLQNGCREELLGEHIRYAERTREVITTIAVEYGQKGGWFSLWQAGGGLKTIIWVQPLIYRMPEVKSDVEGLRRDLVGILHLSEAQTRVKEPYEWLAQKGWPLRNGLCARR